jgi:hypothetical protein
MDEGINFGSVAVDYYVQFSFSIQLSTGHSFVDVLIYFSVITRDHCAKSYKQLLVDMDNYVF